MARIDHFELLVDDLRRESVKLGYTAGKKTVKKVERAPLTKSMTIHEVMAKAGIDLSAAKPFTGKPPVIHEKGVTVGQKVLIRGKRVMRAALPDADDAGVPAVLRHELLKRAIVAHAVANDTLNSPISELMLHRVLRMAKAGQLTDDQARRTVEYHSKGLALPSDVMRAVASNRAN
jgi:hypothetical protein